MSVRDNMRRVLQVLSWLALAATIVPSFLYYADSMDLEKVKWVMLLATIGWFVVTPFWMGRKPEAAS